MTKFTDLDAAREECEFLVQQTGRVHLVKRGPKQRGGEQTYRVCREYINSDDGTILMRLSPQNEVIVRGHA